MSTNHSPIVSIIVPAYCAEHTIERCVGSLLCQTVTDIEIIVVDDGSPDATLSILQRMAAQDPRLVVVHQDNAGVSAARNKGLSVAQAPWVAFVDSDDYVTDDYIEALMPENEDVDFAICSLADVDMDGRETAQRILPDLHAENFKHHVMGIGEAMSSFTVYLLCGPWCKLFRRRIITDFGVSFPEKINFGEDAIFVFSYLQHAERVQATNMVTYFYTHLCDETLKKIRTSIEWYDMCVCIQRYMLSICDHHNVQNRQRLEEHVLDRFTNALSLNSRDHLLTKAQRYATYNIIADFVSPHIYRPRMPFFFPFFAVLRWWNVYEWLVKKIYR